MSAYPKKSKEEIEQAVTEVLKDYKDPTENMTIAQKVSFNDAMKKVAKNMFNNEANKPDINK